MRTEAAPATWSIEGEHQVPASPRRKSPRAFAVPLATQRHGALLHQLLLQGLPLALALVLSACGGAGKALPSETAPAAPAAPAADPAAPADPAATANSSTASPASAGCGPDVASLDSTQVSLARTYADAFAVGVAVNRGVYGQQGSAAAGLVAAQFNRVTAENDMKWQSLEREPGVLDFSEADAFVAFAERHGMEVHGHTLVWHFQVPRWVFEDGKGGRATRAQLLERLDRHMRALSEHFGTRVRYWDVVNEAFSDDGSLRKTPWLEIIGDDYIEQAFRLAAKHFPEAKLVYNDFSMEKPGKRDAVVALVKGFQARGVRIDGVGTQAHFQLESPTLEEIDASLAAFGSTGVEVLVSELDVDVLPAAYENQGADLSLNAELSAQLNPYADCLPSEVAERAARRWADIFAVFSKHADRLHSVTLWGVSDGQSWLNNWPVRGRTNYPLLFDRELRPKRSWESVIRAAGERR